MPNEEMMSASVSLLESYRWWQQSDQDWEEFVARLSTPQTEQMKAGEMFHKALESCTDGSYDTLEYEGYKFVFAPEFSGELLIGNVRETPCSKKYGPLLVRGRVDEVQGTVVTDYKLTFSSVDGERYMESCQWKFYLEMLNCNVFDYKIFEAYEKPDCYLIKKFHPMRLYRYPDLAKDCRGIADAFRATASIHPEVAKYRNVEQEV